MVFFIFLFGGLYIHSTLLGTGLIGILLLGHSRLLPGFMGFQSFPAVATYSLTTIPMYILTAQFILQAGIVEDLFSMVYNFSKGKRGLLGATTLAIGGVLGAVCGSGSATSAALGKAAYPSLVKHGYNSDLAAAVAAAAGSLSSIIPPSVVLIVYGVITETPIGKLFIAGIIPGIATTLTYIACTYYFLARDKKPSDSHEFRPIEIPRKRVVMAALVSVAVSITIFGGIYSGFMTPTEAGAVSAFISLVAAFLLGKVNKAFIASAVTDTVKVTSMIMMIIVGAKIFGKYISLSMLAKKFIQLLNPLLGYPALVLGILIAFYFVCFMFLEGTAVLLITTPILLPLMKAMNIDTLWFGILVCLTCVLGMLTPPVGICIYSVCGVAKIPVERPFRYGAIFAAVCSIIVGGLMIAFPKVVIWLPNLMS